MLKGLEKLLHSTLSCLYSILPEYYTVQISIYILPHSRSFKLLHFSIKDSQRYIISSYINSYVVNAMNYKNHQKINIETNENTIDGL